LFEVIQEHPTNLLQAECNHQPAALANCYAVVCSMVTPMAAATCFLSTFRRAFGESNDTRAQQKGNRWTSEITRDSMNACERLGRKQRENG